MKGSSKLVVGVTEWHGVMQEQALYPPAGVEYISALRSDSIVNRILRSPIKGFFPKINDPRLDIVESLISPVLTKQRWVCSLANFSEVLSFSFAGLPLPRAIRREFLLRLFERENFLGFAFWSEAGLATMGDFRDGTQKFLRGKAHVIHPAIGERANFDSTRYDRPRFLFSGDFFRKGGAQVVDAFEEFQLDYPDAVLHVCSDPLIDFNVADAGLREHYLERIRKNKAIIFGRVPRHEILTKILPATTAYLLPTFDEAYGFAAVEALAFGVPIIATSEFALPEIVDHQVTGWLIPYTREDKKTVMKGYIVQCIPATLSQHISSALFDYMNLIVGDAARLNEMRVACQRVARSRFSFERRNAQLLSLYYR